jgi:hypothetical protein
MRSLTSCSASKVSEKAIAAVVAAIVERERLWASSSCHLGQEVGPKRSSFIEAEVYSNHASFKEGRYKPAIAFKE